MSVRNQPSNRNKRHMYSDSPELMLEFLNYSETIRGLSPRTVNAYYIDLRTFFKFTKRHRGLVDADVDLKEIDIKDIDLAYIKQVDKSEIYEYLYYVTRERNNAPSTRARKLSSIKNFFKYLTSKTAKLTINPAEDIEAPMVKKKLPKYLSLDESIELLNSVDTDFQERDYFMLTLFLNCGLRISELVNIDTTDIKDNTIRIIGKGNKERILYLNDACLNAHQNYLQQRSALKNLKDDKAMFVSKRTGRRLSVRRVQQIVDACFKSAGLDGKGYSPHKLRHTAATLMYQHGDVDTLLIKEMLGHADLSTTQIYTHLNKKQMEDAADANPLSNIKNKKDVESSVESVEKE